MNYRYRKGQIFGKRLKVPKYIRKKFYNNRVSFNDFIAYELDDKVPTSCVDEEDRKIVEKFGLETAKNLDWELLNSNFYYQSIDLKEVVMQIDLEVEDVNLRLYELVKDRIKPRDYSERMKKVYSDRLFDIVENDDLNIEKERFNRGECSLVDLIRNWDLYKKKDLSYCLQSDGKNEFHITDIQLKDFMNEFSNISDLLIENSNIYAFINDKMTWGGVL